MIVDQFKTIRNPSEGLCTDRGSKFIAFAYPIQHEDEAQSLLAALKKSNPKARHFCTAIRLYPDASLERSNDDGEPSGSAGKPILGQLIKNDLTNIAVVVVRYFGGTKLGIPGLIEAYRTATALAIHQADIITVTLLTRITFSMSYERFPSFLNYCRQRDFTIFEEAFSDHAVLTIGMRKSTVETQLLQMLKGFSGMDFTTLEEYAGHLQMEITRTGHDEMVYS